MPTKERLERDRARKMWNDCCCLCGDGPLLKRAMHLTTKSIVPGTEYGPMPVCTSCRDMLATKPLGPAVIKAMKRHVDGYTKMMNVAYMLGIEDLPAPPEFMDEYDARILVERMVERARSVRAAP